MRILLFSNSTNAGEEYLSYTIPYIHEFTQGKKYEAVFIPYAGVTISWDEYSAEVASKLLTTGIHLNPIHKSADPIKAILNAEMIIVGGGNTFNLLKTLEDNKLLKFIREKVIAGVPYIGWSAGSNMACPTIRTTNDMPIVEPKSFNALGLFPFQINPHYTDAVDKNHAGETREMRINEFIEANKDMYVAGLREGTLFQINGNKLELKGSKSCRIFKHGKAASELKSGDDFSFLMQ
ncbi:MAG: dipeptidase PepE [Bacteroidales bacterium]|nr:dipeptidase PepE [Bacteroidales bacterium]MBN2819129.1 dipeptidase PepE [Bacteroidales bacterium]